MREKGAESQNLLPLLLKWSESLHIRGIRRPARTGGKKKGWRAEHHLTCQIHIGPFDHLQQMC